AILLTRSVFAQATENVPKAAGPSSRATRKVKTPRRFDANNAMVLKNAPRLSSNPVLSTGGAVSGIGAARSALSRVLTELLRCHNFSQPGHGLNRVLETDNEDMQHRESTHFFTFLFSGIESGKRPS